MKRRKKDLMKLEQVLVVDLVPHPENYVVHPEDQIEHLAQSIKEHGFYRNVIVAKDNTILAGHGVVEAAILIGIKTVPVHRLNIKSDSSQAKKILIGDNEIAHLREVDDRMLTDMLKEISDQEETLLGTGYDEMMLSALLLATRSEDEIEDFDAAAEWTGADMPPHIEGKDAVKIVINFRTENKRAEFLKRHDFGDSTQANRGTKSFWWPAKDAK